MCKTDNCFLTMAKQQEAHSKESSIPEELCVAVQYSLEMIRDFDIDFDALISTGIMISGWQGPSGEAQISLAKLAQWHNTPQKCSSNQRLLTLRNQQRFNIGSILVKQVSNLLRYPLIDTIQKSLCPMTKKKKKKTDKTKVLA